MLINVTTRLIQDNNLGQGYRILVPKWLKSCPKTYFRKNNREEKKTGFGKVRG